MNSTTSAILNTSNSDWKLLLGFLKVLISWPVVSGLAIIYFRENITRFIDRLYKARLPGGTELEAERQIGTKILTEEQKTAIEEELTKQKKLIKTIKKEYSEKLEKAQTDKQKAITDLINEISIRDLQLEFERIYHLIFGSQISLLEKLLTKAPLGSSQQEILIHFVLVQRAWTPTFNTWTLNQYLNFLLIQRLIEITTYGNYKLTDKGRAFLLYITNLGYIKNKSL